MNFFLISLLENLVVCSLIRIFAASERMFVSLQRQNVCFDYPGKFPERASRIRHYPIYKAVHQCAALILSKPLPLVITQTRLVLLSLTRGFDFI